MKGGKEMFPNDIEKYLQNLGDKYGERMWVDFIIEEIKKQNSKSKNIKTKRRGKRK